MENNKWYLFGRWIEPVLAYSFWLEFQSKELGIDFFGDVKTLDGYYFLLKSDLETMDRFVEKKINNEKGYFDKFFPICEEKVKNVFYYKEHKDLSGFLVSLQELFQYCMIIHLFDHGLLKYLEKINETTGVSSEKVLKQIKPYKKTILMQYHEELKNLDKSDIPDFIKKWEWVGTHLFMGDPLNESKLKEELANINNVDNQIIYKKLPKVYDYTLELGSKLAYQRSYMVEAGGKSMFTYRQDIKELGEKYGLSWDEVLLLTYRETINLNNKGILPEGFKQRAKAYGVVLENKKLFIVVGEELEKRLNECLEKNDKNVTEVKGMVACKGEIMRGVVRIIEESKYLSKMNKGDILVANETTPDYILGMKIAGAIITNQGGITSHAAITSREMNIPCIIGTKNATGIFKDGDMVEVDTEKGIVRIINKKNGK